VGSAIDPSDEPHGLGAIYVGDVVHKRARPKRHALRYRVFSMLVDLDRLEALDEKLRVFSLNRFNLVSLVTGDFGPRDGSSIAAFIRRKAEAAGAGPIARIRMLAYPRLLGFAFNPITVYYCDDADGVTKFLAYEVSNTFGEHHFYSAAVSGGRPKSTTRPKRLFSFRPSIRLKAIIVFQSARQIRKSFWGSPCRPRKGVF